MKRILLGALASCALMNAPVAFAEDRDGRRDDRTTIAVIGDWPYNKILLESAPLLINSINSDRAVRAVVHVGDTKSGSSACTGAGFVPPLPVSNPGYNQKIYSLFQQFRTPVVYTPGDNEWTDCHRNPGTGDPLKELASIRELFFARPGKTLGLEDRDVFTQAKLYDRAFPADAKFVENVAWEEADVLFVTLHIVGSNNGLVARQNFVDALAQQQEVAERNAATTRWMQAAFRYAVGKKLRGLVFLTQADMWDSFAFAAGEHTAFTGFINELANATLAFRRPVLLINGDSHTYFSDKPLADPSSATGKMHNAPAVPNLNRITVQGSTVAPAEWLRLTVDPRSPGLFSWTNVVYCANPTLSCP